MIIIIIIIVDVRHVSSPLARGKEADHVSHLEAATSPACLPHGPRGKTAKEPKGYPQRSLKTLTSYHVRHPSNLTRGPHQRAT